MACVNSTAQTPVNTRNAVAPISLFIPRKIIVTLRHLDYALWFKEPPSLMNLAAFFRGKSVLITGASSGIGEELALQLAEADAYLTLAARRMPLLDALAKRIVDSGRRAPLVTECDVTQDGDVERAVAACVG